MFNAMILNKRYVVCIYR